MVHFGILADFRLFGIFRPFQTLGLSKKSTTLIRPNLFSANRSAVVLDEELTVLLWDRKEGIQWSFGQTSTWRI
jgi:hypothetical protein